MQQLYELEKVRVEAIIIRIVADEYDRMRVSDQQLHQAFWKFIEHETKGIVDFVFQQMQKQMKNTSLMGTPSTFYRQVWFYTDIVKYITQQFGKQRVSSALQQVEYDITGIAGATQYFKDHFHISIPNFDFTYPIEMYLDKKRFRKQLDETYQLFQGHELMNIIFNKIYNSTAKQQIDFSHGDWKSLKLDTRKAIMRVQKSNMAKALVQLNKITQTTIDKKENYFSIIEQLQLVFTKQQRKKIFEFVLEGSEVTKSLFSTQIKPYIKSIKFQDCFQDGIITRFVFILFFAFGLIVRHKFNLAGIEDIDPDNKYFLINPVSQLRYSEREIQTLLNTQNPDMSDQQEGTKKKDINDFVLYKVFSRTFVQVLAYHQIECNQSLLVSAKTGQGKSAHFPVLLYYHTFVDELLTFNLSMDKEQDNFSVVNFVLPTIVSCENVYDNLKNRQFFDDNINFTKILMQSSRITIQQKRINKEVETRKCNFVVLQTQGYIFQKIVAQIPPRMISEKKSDALGRIIEWIDKRRANKVSSDSSIDQSLIQEYLMDKYKKYSELRLEVLIELETKYQQFQTHEGEKRLTRTDFSQLFEKMDSIDPQGKQQFLELLTYVMQKDPVSGPKEGSKEDELILGAPHNKYIIFDEAHKHEVIVDMAITFLMYQQFMLLGKFKMFIMSATIQDDEDRIYQMFDYFNLQSNQVYVYKIDNERSHREYLWETRQLPPQQELSIYKITEVPDFMYYEDRKKQIIKGIQSEISGKYEQKLQLAIDVTKHVVQQYMKSRQNMLVFVCRVADCIKLAETLQQVTSDKILCLPYYSDIAPTIKNLILNTKRDIYNMQGIDKFNAVSVSQGAPPSERTTIFENIILICTSVLEESVTLQDTYYVIDTGYKLEKINIQRTIIKQLQPIDRNSYLQRKGRTGRKNDGYFFPLYDPLSLKPRQQRKLEVMDLVVFQGITQFIKRNAVMLVNQIRFVEFLENSPYHDIRNLLIDLFFNSDVYISRLPSFHYLVSKILQPSEGEQMQIKEDILQRVDYFKDITDYIDVVELLEDEQEKTLVQQMCVLLHSQRLMQRFGGYIFMEQCLAKTENDIMQMVYFYSIKKRQNYIKYSLDIFQHLLDDINSYINEKLNFYGSLQLNCIFIYLLSSRIKKIGKSNISQNIKDSQKDLNTEVQQRILKIHQQILRIAERNDVKMSIKDIQIERHFAMQNASESVKKVLGDLKNHILFIFDKHINVGSRTDEKNILQKKNMKKQQQVVDDEVENTEIGAKKWGITFVEDKNFDFIFQKLAYINILSEQVKDIPIINIPNFGEQANMLFYFFQLVVAQRRSNNAKSVYVKKLDIASALKQLQESNEWMNNQQRLLPIGTTIQPFDFFFSSKIIKDLEKNKVQFKIIQKPQADTYKKLSQLNDILQ